MLEKVLENAQTSTIYRNWFFWTFNIWFFNSDWALHLNSHCSHFNVFSLRGKPIPWNCLTWVHDSFRKATVKTGPINRFSIFEHKRWRSGRLCSKIEVFKIMTRAPRDGYFCSSLSCPCPKIDSLISFKDQGGPLPVPPSSMFHPHSVLVPIWYPFRPRPLLS